MAEQNRTPRSSRNVQVPRGTTSGRGRHSSSAAGQTPERKASYATTKPVAVGAAARKQQHAAAQQSKQAQQVIIEDEPKKKKKKKKGSIGWRILFWFALIVLVGTLGTLGVFGFSYWNGQQRANSLANDVLEADDLTGDVTLASLTVDWEALREKNSEVVAWIYMPDTPINYPVAYSGDDTKYLTTTFDGYSSVVSYGTIFLEGLNSPTFSDQMNIMYGHNMLDGSMFAAVTKLASDAEFNSHRTVYLLTPMGNYRLKSFALLHVESTDPLVQQNFPSEGGFASYIQNKMNRSVVTPDTPLPNSNDITKAFALLTCDDRGSNSGRYVLYCYVAESTVPGVVGLEQNEDGSMSDIDPYSVEDLGMQVADR